MIIISCDLYWNCLEKKNNKKTNNYNFLVIIISCDLYCRVEQSTEENNFFCTVDVYTTVMHKKKQKKTLVIFTKESYFFFMRKMKTRYSKQLWFYILISFQGEEKKKL